MTKRRSSRPGHATVVYGHPHKHPPSGGPPSGVELDTLSPKEIQARIRAGASPEELADETGVDLERIERFAGPPLAERAWACDQARGTVLRRDGGEESLDALVAARSAADGVDPESVSWDAWRREDGRWSIVVAYRGDERLATWVFDPHSRSVHPEDETALRMGASDTVIPLHTAAQQTLAVERLAEVIVVEDDDREPAAVADILTVREPEPEPAPSKSKKGRRASVPSWDEILFGAGQPDN